MPASSLTLMPRMSLHDLPAVAVKVAGRGVLRGGGGGWGEWQWWRLGGGGGGGVRSVVVGKVSNVPLAAHAPNRHRQHRGRGHDDSG